jgi:hypothetical protein
MTHREKVDRLIVEMQSKGVNPYTAAPPVFRLLWSMGIEVPPPHFLSFMTITLVMGTFFGVFWGGLMWLLLWRNSEAPGIFNVTVPALAGLFFGLAMAWLLRRKAARLQLPAWKDYPERGK